MLEMESITLKLRKEIVLFIVEDDQGHYLLIKNCLRRAGIDNEIVWFEDGQAAMDYVFSENSLDSSKRYIMLLDIRMPKVDGLKVLEQLKQNDVTKEIPVIMLTTSEDRDVARQCYELGCFAHIIKPPGDVLLRAIQRVCERY